jgi:hypothetical protein
MNSVARRILGKADADVIDEYDSERSAARVADLWQNQVDWPERVSAPIPLFASPTTRGTSLVTPVPILAAERAGRKRALCIGINEYATAPLAGCVADAQEWSRAFVRLGFQTAILSNRDATRNAIINNWSELIESSAPGDVIALQFAGHGTHLPDLNGDEEDSRDEAICPYDFADGAFLIDDDIRELFSKIPDGVNVTCFFDCCHSGTATRLAVGTRFGTGRPSDTGRPSGTGRPTNTGRPMSRSGGVTGHDRRPRFIPATEELKAAHQKFRARTPQSRSASPANGYLMKNILFSACQPHEVAWESDGHGDFTLRAVSILSSGIDGMTNQQFVDRVVADFGYATRQRPMVDFGDPSIGLQPLLAPISQPLSSGITVANPWRDSKAETIQTLQLLIEKLKMS